MARSYCFTTFDVETPIALEEGMRYLIYQKEKCPETGKEHFQGYVKLNKVMRIPGVKKLLKKADAHLETRKGTRDQARDYCRKEESRLDGPWELGEWIGGQGERSDLKRAFEMVNEGSTELEIAEAMPETWARSYRALERYKRLKVSKRSWMPEVYIYWGAPGSGKSKKAFEENPDAYWLSKTDKACGWWDAYDGHEVVIIDEFYGWLSYDFLLRLLDRYPLNVENKGGSTPFLAKKIIFTSNKCWEDWYPNIVDKSALRRRIKEEVHMTV